AEGNHTFAVRARDAANNVDASPATYTWKVDTVVPDTTIGAKPSNPSSVATASFTYTASEAGVTFECSLDGAAFASCPTSNPNYSSLAEGNHTFAVRARDAANNVDATPASYTWKVDTLAPDTTIGAKPSNPSNVATASFTYTSNEAGVTFECQLDSAGFGACPTGNPNYSGLAEGNHTFDVRARDAANNVDATPATYTWKVDTLPPDTTIGAKPSNPSPVATATFTYTSNESGVTFECSLDGAAFANCPTSNPTYSGLAEGNHTFQVRARDAASNVDATPASYTWKVDTLAPDTTIGTKPSNPSLVATANFTYTSNESGVTFECQLDGAGFGACPAGNPNYSGLAEGNHTFDVRARDAANNVDPTPATYTWKVDTVDPNTTITSGPPTPWSTVSTAVFTYSASETATFECKLDLGSFAACPAATVTLTGLGEGAHTFSVRAIDTAGRVDQTPATYSWSVDTITPNTSFVTGPVNPSASSSASFTYSATETATFECKLDTGAFVACPTAGVTYSSLIDGSHTVQVRATDPAGRTDASPATYTWTVNVAGPVITQAPPTGWTVNYFTFQYTTIAGAPTYQCNITAGLPAAGWFGCSAGAYGATNASYGFANTFGVRWVDAAGVASSSSSTTWTPNTGLVLYYPHDADAKNYSILDFPTSYYGHHGDLDPVIQGGVAGGAGFFPSGTNYKGTITPLQSGVAYTVGVWISMVAANSVDPLWSNRGPDGGCELAVRDLTAFLRCYDSAGQVESTAAALPSAIWTHVAFTYAGAGHGAGKGGPVQLFINGNAAGNTLTNQNKVDYFPAKQADAMFSGKFGSATALSDELRIYNRALSNKALCEQVAFGVFDGTRGTCTAVPGTAIAFDNFPTTTPMIQRGRHSSVPFSNGNNAPAFPSGVFGPSLENLLFSSVILGNFNKDINNDEDHTLSVWFFDDGSSSAGGTIFNFMEGSGMAATVNGGLLYVDAKGITNVNTVVSAGDKTPYSTGAWHHLVIAIDGVTDVQGFRTSPKVDLYLDGKLWTTLSLPGAGVFVNTAPNLSIGPRNSGQTNLAVDELKIWTTDLRLNGAAVFCQAANAGTYDWLDGSCTLPQPPKPF
ncbi:MAG: LamG domain-containing protein, partial [Deltaproteobacteria bacterium]|nr:LamG domain-containing protein [Deltaproteobacteria bacterium]